MYTDRFSKRPTEGATSFFLGGGGIRGHDAAGKFSDFNSQKSPFLGFLFIQDIGQFHSPRKKPCNLESFLFIKNISIM